MHTATYTCPPRPQPAVCVQRANASADELAVEVGRLTARIDDVQGSAATEGAKAAERLRLLNVRPRLP